MLLSFHLQQTVYGSMFHPVLIFIISSLSLYLFTKWLFNPPSAKIQPPSPPKLPILGNLHQIGIFAHRSLESLGKKYGPVMLLHFGSKPVLIIQSAEGAMEIMKKHDLAFADKPTSRTIRRILYDLKDITTAPYGDYWRKLKSLCVLQLLSNKRVQSFSFIMEEEAAVLVGKIKACCSSPVLQPVNLSEMFVSSTNNMICRAAFGKKYSEGESGKKLLMLLEESMHLMGSVSIGDYIPRLSWINRVNGFDARVDKVAKDIDSFLEVVIQEHLDSRTDRPKDEEGRENFLDLLLELYKETINGTASIDKDNVKAIILNLILGGTDTTFATLVWAMTEILRHPFVMNKLQEEAREIISGKQDTITHNDLEKMPYLKAVVRETLRYHTPIPLFGRLAREDIQVMGYDIAAGTMVITNAWAISQDPVSWDEPEKFQPERFLNSSIDYRGLDFELIPFGAGRRGCPGISFATTSVELVLANLVQKFTWVLPQGMNNEDLDVTECPGVTIHRKNPLIAVATPCCF